MADLTFAIEGAEPVVHAATPLVALKLRVATARPDAEIHAALLRCQVQIDPARVAYGPDEEELLADLFGARSRWSETLRPMLWTTTMLTLPRFTGSVVTELVLPASLDLHHAWSKYFYALKAGEVPLVVFFSGTIFHGRASGGEGGTTTAAPVPWNREARFRLPVSAYRAAIDQHWRDTAPLTLRADVFDRLHRYRIEHALPTWERALEHLLSRS